jgi:F-type H+-transporting ATPase subunit epsilon
MPIMPKHFKVAIVTPEKTAFESDAVSVNLPGTEGYLGIWADHAPLVTALVPGVVTVREHERGNTGDARFLAVSGGFVEIAHNEVIILSDTCEDAGEIDLERAKKARERAMNRLKAPEPGIDLDRARAAAERAEARLRAAYLREGK